MKKNIMDMIEEILLENKNINCTKTDFLDKLKEILEEDLEKDIIKKENDLFIEEKDLFDYLSTNNMNFYFTKIIKKVIRSFNSHNIEKYDLIKGISLSKESSSSDVFFEILGYKNITAVLPNVFFSPGDDYRENKVFYLLVEKVLLDSQIDLVVSRNKSLLVEKLIFLFCKEVNEYKVAIDGIAREPGIKTKILVKNVNENYSGILSLVGKNSFIVNSISNELKEIVQIFELIPKKIKETYINLMYPIDVEDLEIDEESISYYVKEKDLAKAIGKKGVNVKLISSLTRKKVLVKNK